MNDDDMLPCGIRAHRPAYCTHQNLVRCLFVGEADNKKMSLRHDRIRHVLNR
jgi:hypothetical protein